MDKEKNHFVLAGSQAKRLSLLSILLILSKACHAQRLVLVFADRVSGVRVCHKVSVT